MGAWGTGIFSDDTAADVREDWREAIMDGLDPAAATQKLVDQYGEVLEDNDEATVFWLALAASQLQTGRLQKDIRDRALSIIDAGSDLGRWREQDKKLARQREKVLERLAAKLRGAQREPTRLKRPKPRPAGLDLGDVVRLRHPETGEAALTVVVGFAAGWPTGTWNPVVAVLVGEAEPLPEVDEMRQMPLLRNERDNRIELNAMHNARRGKLALANVGEIVAHGVPRSDAAAQNRWEEPSSDISYSGWPVLAQEIGTEYWRRRVELTLRVQDRR